MSVDTTTARHVTQAGLDLIKSFEGCRLKAYKCPAGVWTCGYGSTGPDVGPDTEWTQDQAVARLASEFSAMVCLSYNIGLGNLAKSSVLRLHNQSDRKGAADAFLMWTKAGGKELPGLVRRRDAERSLYLG